MDPRMERLDPPVEHLRRAGHGRDVGDRQAGLAQRACRPAGRHRARSRGPTRPAPELDQPGLVRDRQQRPSRDRDVPLGPCRSRRAPGRPRSPTAPEASSATARGRSRCSTAWIRVGEARPRRRRATTGTASWTTIGPPSSVWSTRWTVQPVTVTPCASASADRVGARERRQERRMDVEDPPAERRQHQRARRRACSPPARRSSAPTAVSAASSVASSPPGTRAVSNPLSAAHRAPGTADRRTRGRSAAEPAAFGRRRQRPQVRARPRDADRDPRGLDSRSALEGALDVARALEPAASTTSPTTDAGDRRRVAARRSRRGDRRGRRSTTTMPRPPLNVARSSAPSMPAEAAQQADGPTAAASAPGRGGRPGRPAWHAARCPAARRR